eukprot:TRINITY_DN12309_c0_g1_i1.p1 TRINITY_DN12309_c0_g1~~TRINITY_DN12309_c0_g1_i1.p1  ORF type:complete len:220 (+),score=42.62 TRINITY_DN12309_c0_g1_i1:104-763(+)
MGASCPGGACQVDALDLRSCSASEASADSVEKQAAAVEPQRPRKRRLRVLQDVGHLPAWHDALPRICATLTAAAKRNTAEGHSSPSGAVFEGTPPAAGNLENYLAHLVRYSICNAAVWVAVTALLRRLEAGAGVRPTESNVHRLVFTAYMLAAKIMDDRGYANAAYAQIGFVSQGELYEMEAAFLRGVEWRLVLSTQEYEDELARCRSESPQQGAVRAE